MCERYFILRWVRPLRYPTRGPRYEIHGMSEMESDLAWPSEVEVVTKDLSFDEAIQRQAELNRLEEVACSLATSS